MKIIGFIFVEDNYQMVLKGDSCMLVNRKPLFIPDWTTDLRMTPCAVVRVSRLGKSVEARFANRYFDVIAPGLDFIAWDKWQEAKHNGSSWTSAQCFDYSLAIGEWLEDIPKVAEENLILPIAQAIEEASRIMTIRQGDLLYIQYRQAPYSVKRDEVISGPNWAEDKLYCKIK